MEKEPAQQILQQEQTTATPAIAATGQDNMPVLPPPPFTITSSGPGGVERSGVDTLSPAIKPQGMAPPPFKIEASSRPALPQGRLIAQSVGAGGVNHAEDVAQVLARLRMLKVITTAEEADQSAIAAYVTRYQSLVNDSPPDGLIEPGRKTEDRLIAGTLTRAAKPKPEQKPATQPGKTKAVPEIEQKARAEYRRILQETPATEAGAEAILARGETFAANAFADLARMRRFDLLHALKEEVWAIDRDWIARAIAQRLSDAELAALPKEFLAQLRDALDAGVTGADEYALMDRLNKAMGKTKAAGKDPEAEDKANTSKQMRSNKGLFVVSTAEAYIRDEKFEVMPGKLFPRWIDVRVTKEATHDGITYAYTKAANGSAEGWTAKANLYSLDWSAKANEKVYREQSDTYYKLMAVNDPKITGKDMVMSGAEAKITVDRYFPNYTDMTKLDDSFRPKVEGMINGLKPHGIHIKVNAGLRHPLRSVVFDYCLDIGNRGTIDMIEEANAVCRKYGIPIDWAHRDEDGAIDLAKSKKAAAALRSAFGIKGAAARGVKDFGGSISNHNDGMAVDLKISFDFTATKDITVGGKTYSIDPNEETKDKIDNVINTPLSKLGKEQYGITRAKKEDTVHWSVSGR